MVLATAFHRHLCSELVSVTELNRDHPRRITANLEEIGRSSVLILVEDRIKRGTRLLIQRSGTILKGTVKTCRFEDQLGFFLSIRLDWDSKWSPEWFMPEHMLFMFGPRAQVLPLGKASGY